MRRDIEFGAVVRINEIGAALSREFVADADQRKAIARELDLARLDEFRVDITLKPARVGWTLSGRVRADLAQTCGITLEPLPAQFDEAFSLDMREAIDDSQTEIEVCVDEDGPDLIEDGKIDLGRYGIEQLALLLDPFPRKLGASFVQPEEPDEVSPFAVLSNFRKADDDTAG